MKRGEVVKRLDIIRDMSNQDIAINAEWIKEVAQHAYSLLKQQPRMVKEQAVRRLEGNA